MQRPSQKNKKTNKRKQGVEVDAKDEAPTDQGNGRADRGHEKKIEAKDAPNATAQLKAELKANDAELKAKNAELKKLALYRELLRQKSGSGTPKPATWDMQRNVISIFLLSSTTHAFACCFCVCFVLF